MGADRANEIVAGRFCLERLLGTGNYGAVWLADDRASGRQVALKLLHDRHRDRGRVRDRFEREAEITASLQHRNIARIVASDTDADEPYIAFELARGMTLRAIIDGAVTRERPLDTGLLRRVIEQLADALDHAHRSGVVHRDLKPANVLIDVERPTLDLTILDFGVARLSHARPTFDEQTTQGRVIGTVLYSSPEAVLGESIDHRTDLFALGTMVFELVTLRQPWLRDERGRALSRVEEARMNETRDNETFAIMQRLAREPRPRSSTYRRGVSERLEQAIERALAFAPGDRFGRAGDLEAAILPELAALEELVLEQAGDTLPPDEATPILVPGPPLIEDTAISPVAWDPAGPDAEPETRRDRPSATSDALLPAVSSLETSTQSDPPTATIHGPLLEVSDVAAEVSPVSDRPISTVVPAQVGFRLPLRTVPLMLAAAALASFAVSTVYLARAKPTAAVTLPDPTDRQPRITPLVAAVPAEAPRSDDRGARAEEREPEVPSHRAHVVSAKRPILPKPAPAGTEEHRPNDELAEIFVRLDANPRDPELIQRAGTRIIAVARTLPADRGGPIERLAVSAMMTFDAEKLALCRRMLVAP